MRALILFLAQGFGVGRIPLAPGTFGSLVGLIWFAMLLGTKRYELFLLGAQLLARAARASFAQIWPECAEYLARHFTRHFCPELCLRSLPGGVLIRVGGFLPPLRHPFAQARFRYPTR